jgi:catechol-2,3-dioxygenase
MSRLNDNTIVINITHLIETIGLDWVGLPDNKYIQHVRMCTKLTASDEYYKTEIT